MRVEPVFLLTDGPFQDNTWTHFLNYKTIADGMTLLVGLLIKNITSIERLEQKIG